MTKRKMPPHIVLPNGMWRFVKRGAKKASKIRHRGSRIMARKHYRRGGGGMMGKLLSKKNLMYTLGAVIVGSAVLKVDPKMAGAVGGFMGAGIPGAVAGYVAAPTIASIGGGLLNRVGTAGVYTY